MTIIRLYAIIDSSRSEYVQAIKDTYSASMLIAIITRDYKDTIQAIEYMLRIVSSKYPGVCTGVKLDEMTKD